MMIARIHETPIVIEGDSLKRREYSGMNFHRCILDDLNFSESNMTDVDFRSAEMNRANFTSVLFSRSKLIMVNAHNSIMDESIFNEALILHSDFGGSSLKKANFSKCILNRVLFKNCDIRGANFNCLGLETCDFSGAIYDESTIWSEAFNIADYETRIYN